MAPSGKRSWSSASGGPAWTPSLPLKHCGHPRHAPPPDGQGIRLRHELSRHESDGGQLHALAPRHPACAAWQGTGSRPVLCFHRESSRLALSEAAVHRIGAKDVREALPQCKPRFIAQVTGIRVRVLMRQVVFLYERRRPTLAQRTAHRMVVRIVCLANVLEAPLEDVADVDAG